MLRPRPHAPLLLLVALAVVIAACGGNSSSDDGAAAIVSMPDGQASPYAGIVRTPAPNVGALSLPAPDGAPFAFTGRPGGVLLVYFGFTHCPDVCPTTLADLRTALRSLTPEERDRIDVAMVTVDPERDTPKLLTAYVQSFVPDGVALSTTDAAKLKKVADAFAVAYGVTKQADGSVDVTHSAFLYAIGPDGRLIVQWPFGTTSADEANDIRTMLADIGSTDSKESS